MDIFINTDKSPAQLQGKATGSPLSSFRVKRGASVPLSVTILGSDSASGLRMGIKAKGSTSSKSSPCCPFFAPSATKMQETRNKMPATLELRGGD